MIFFIGWIMMVTMGLLDIVYYLLITSEIPIRISEVEFGISILIKLSLVLFAVIVYKKKRSVIWCALSVFITLGYMWIWLAILKDIMFNSETKSIIIFPIFSILSIILSDSISILRTVRNSKNAT